MLEIVKHSHDSLLYRILEKKSKEKRLCKVLIVNNIPEKQCKEIISYYRNISTIPCIYVNKYIHYNNLNDCVYYISKEYPNSLESINLQHVVETKEYISLIKDIIYTTDILHNNNIINGNIKPSNILLSNEDNHFYLSDYGNYILYNHDDNTEPFIQSKISMCYLSPEVIKSSQYDLLSNDIWSIGCVIYYILHNGLNPFIGKNIFEIYNNIIYLKYDSGVKEEQQEENEFSKIYLMIFQSNYEKRPTISKLIDLLSQTSDFKNDIENSSITVERVSNLSNNMLNSVAKENNETTSEIISFYNGEGLYNYKTCAEYYCRSDDEIRLWCPIYDLSFLFPLIGQNDPTFTITDQHSIYQYEYYYIIS